MKHYRGFKIKCLGATDYLSSRIKITDERFDQSKIINCSAKYSHTLEQAIDFLKNNGFNIVGYSEMKIGHVIFCDNWGNDCIKLKDIK